MTSLYLSSDAERQESAIETIYEILDRFPARENKNFSLPKFDVLRSMLLLVVTLASINLLALAYIALVLWS